MAILTVSARGRVTLPRAIMQRLGIRPGDNITLDLLPHGRAQLSAERPKGTWESVRGMLKSNGRRLTVDEINEAIEDAGAEAGMAGLMESAEP